MGITTPTKVQIAKEWELLLPDMGAQPLQKALENINYHWKHYRPAMTSAGMTADPALTRTGEYHWPVVVSQQTGGMRYSFEVRFVCSNASQNVTVSVDYTTAYVAGGASVWVAICSDVVVSNGTGGLLTTHQKADQAVPVTAVALRLQLTAPAAGDRTDHHVLAWPTPAATSAGLQAGGFAPFDDTLLASGQLAAIHTEWINRCKASHVALLNDRAQNAYSFLQEYRTAPRWRRTDVTSWTPLPPMRIWLPGQSGTVTLAVKAIAEVNAGATADLVRFRQVGIGGSGASVLIAASGAIETAALLVQVQGSGLLSVVDVELALRTTAGNTTRVFAVMAWHTPGS